MSNRSDDFNRTGAVALGGSTPSDSGSTWINSDGAFKTADDGGGTVVAYEGGTFGATNLAWLEASTTDADVSAVITRVDDSGGVTGRVADANNLYLWRAKTDGTTELYSRVSGSFTLLATGSLTFTPGAAATLKLTMLGTAIKGFVGASQSASVTNSDLTTGTKQGIYSANSFNFFDSFAVTDTAAGGTTVTPSTAALTLTTFAPTVSTPVAVTPSTASLTLTTFAPSVTAGGNQSVTPDTLALTLTTFAPTVAAGGNQEVTPTTASLTFTTFAPTVSTPVAVTPSTLALSLTTFEPTVTVSGSASVTPGTLALVLTMYAPTVTGGGDIGGLVCAAATITTRVAGTPSLALRITGTARLTECC